jgi:hypothetical protein
MIDLPTIIAVQAALLGFTVSNCIVFGKYMLFALKIPTTDSSQRICAAGLIMAVTIIHACTIPQRWYHNPKRIGMDQNHCRCIHGICGHLGRHFQTHADPTECVPSQATSFLGSHMVVFGMASQHARNIFLQIFICIFWLRQRQQCPGSHPHLQP